MIKRELINVKSLADHLINPEKKYSDVSSTTADSNWFRAPINLDGKDLLYVATLIEAGSKVEGIAIFEEGEENSRPETYREIPLKDFKPEYRTRILEEVALSSEFSVFRDTTERHQRLVNSVLNRVLTPVAKKELERAKGEASI